MFKKITVFCVVFLLLFFVVGLAACSNDEKLDQSILESGTGVVQKSDVFPSELEDFKLADFSDSFFEDNALIIVPFENGYLMHDNIDFYTVFVKDGKLNFVIELTHSFDCVEFAMDRRVFGVWVSKEVLEKYEIGKKIVFYTYDFKARNNPFEEPPLSDRSWLAEVQENSVKHRAGFIRAGFISISPIGDNIIVISSRQAFSEHNITP